MYLPAHFAEPRRDALEALMRTHPLATLIGTSENGLFVEHIPLHWVPGTPDRLIGHVARANPVWQAWPQGHTVKAVFHGPQAYVSPALYPSKAEHGKVVPTWNYTVVHVDGRVRWAHEPGAMRAILETLTNHHEARRERPWAVGDAPADFTTAMMTAVVGLSIEVTGIQGKFKLSQNRSAADHEGVRRGLQGGADASTAATANAALAAMMRR